MSLGFIKKSEFLEQINNEISKLSGYDPKMALLHKPSIEGL